MRQLVHAVPVQPGRECKAHQDGVVIRSDIDAETAQDDHVVFEVMPNLQHAGRFEQRFEQSERAVAVDLHRLFGEHVSAAVRQRDIAGAVGRGCETDADQPGLGRIQPGGLGIDRDDPGAFRLRDPAGERRLVSHGFIGIEIDRLVGGWRGRRGC